MPAGLMLHERSVNLCMKLAQPVVGRQGLRYQLRVLYCSAWLALDILPRLFIIVVIIIDIDMCVIIWRQLSTGNRDSKLTRWSLHSTNSRLRLLKWILAQTVWRGFGNFHKVIPFNPGFFNLPRSTAQFKIKSEFVR